jgi:N-acetylglucosaminyl-diphospho-decaprenol L-rhamnosyltransferase
VIVSPEPRLTVVLVSYNTRGLLAPCLDALRTALRDEPSARIIVVDNASADDSVAFLRANYPDVTLIRSERNVGFGRANNLALPHVDTPYVLLLNTDAFVEADTIAKTMAHMEAAPRCGILGVRLVGRDGVLQPSCRYFPTPWNSFIARAGLDRWFKGVRLIDDMQWNHAAVRDCDWVPGCYYLVRRAVIDQVGLFDPRYFLYFEEVDHCHAARAAGWAVTYFPDTTVVHLGGESAKSEGRITQGSQQLESMQMESALLYFRKNHGLAGLFAHLFLDSVADLVLLARRILKNQRPLAAGEFLARLGKTSRLLKSTGFARRATR